MRHTHLTITHKETRQPGWWELSFTAPDLTGPFTPGQFLLLRPPDRFASYLPRPIFPRLINEVEFALLLRPTTDPGLAWLLSRQVGDQVAVSGPAGRGFPLPGGLRHVCLVSDTTTIDPLLGQMMVALQKNLAVTLALGASRQQKLYPVKRLPPAVEVQIATLDGSLGHRGPVTELLPELLQWADVVYATGTATLFASLRHQMAEVRLGVSQDFLYGLIEQPFFGCGIGACLACSIKTETGPQQVCTDGPVFDLVSLTIHGL